MQQIDAAAIAVALGGIASRAQLVAAGASGTDITRAMRLGTLRRIRRAHYAIPRAPRDGMEAVRIGGRLDGMSAAATYGLWTASTGLQVVVAPNASRLRAPIDPTTRIRWADAGVCRECWRTGLPTTIREVARGESREAAIACLDTARTAFGLSTRTMLDWVGGDSLARSRVLGTADGSESGWESIVRQRLERCGTPVTQQLPLPIPGTRRGDLFVGGCLVVEVDGFEYHGDRDAFERDHRRDAELAAAGVRHIRLTVRQVRDDWPATESSILAAARWRTPRFSGTPATDVAHVVPFLDFRRASTAVS